MIKNIDIPETTFLGNKIYELGIGNFELSKGKWCISINKSRKVRSVQQNRMYWGYVLSSIALETGYEIDELHEYFKSLMETKEIVISKTSKQVPVSTKKMDTKQFVEYIERIRQFTLHNLNFSIPTMDEITIDQIREMEEKYSNRLL